MLDVTGHGLVRPHFFLTPRINAYRGGLAKHRVRLRDVAGQTSLRTFISTMHPRPAVSGLQ